MSFLASLRIMRAVRPQPFPAAASLLVRRQPLSSAAILRHKESENNDPTYTIEQLKEQSIQQQKAGQGQWNPALASDSEEDIKADRAALAEREAAEAAEAAAAREKAAEGAAAREKAAQRKSQPNK